MMFDNSSQASGEKDPKLNEVQKTVPVNRLPPSLKGVKGKTLIAPITG